MAADECLTGSAPVAPPSSRAAIEINQTSQRSSPVAAGVRPAVRIEPGAAAMRPAARCIRISTYTEINVNVKPKALSVAGNDIG